MTITTKQKGNLLEDVVERLCSGIKDAKVTKNAMVLGKVSGEMREVDVLIEGLVGIFSVKIIVEAKNYTKPVGVERVESLKSKLDDVGGDLGVIVCPSGFTRTAKALSVSNGIKLFEIVDPELGNSDLFIPLRLVLPTVEGYSYEVIHRTLGEFSISQDISRWMFHVGDERLNVKQLVWHAWNTSLIPQNTGDHIVNLNAMTMSDIESPNDLQYCEIKIHTKVAERYYLKLVPASFFKDSASGKSHFNLDIRLASREEDMIKTGWREFDSLEEMNKSAEIENQPEEIRGVIIRPSYEVDIHHLVE